MIVTVPPRRRRARRLARVLLWLLAGLVLLLALLAAIAQFAFAPGPFDAALARRAPPPPAIDTAPQGGKPTLILLHGAGLNAHMWDGVIRALDPRWRVIAIDLPGHGARAGEAFTLDAATRAVADAAARAAPQPVVLSGDSLGGFTAYVAAAAIPRAQLRGLVACGATGSFPARMTATDWATRMFIRWNLALRDQDALARGALGRFPLPPADAQAMLDAGVHLGVIESAADALSGVDFKAHLRKLDAPVLFLNGEFDGRLAEEPAFVAAARDGRAHRFPGIGHGVSMLRPADYAAQLDAFADREFARDALAARAAAADAPAPAPDADPAAAPGVAQ